MTCPICGATLDAHAIPADAADAAPPRLADMTVCAYCAYCASVLVFSGDGLRVMTAQERHELPHESQEDLDGVIRMVRSYNAFQRSLRN